MLQSSYHRGPIRSYTEGSMTQVHLRVQREDLTLWMNLVSEISWNFHTPKCLCLTSLRTYGRISATWLFFAFKTNFFPSSSFRNKLRDASTRRNVLWAICAVRFPRYVDQHKLSVAVTLDSQMVSNHSQLHVLIYLDTDRSSFIVSACWMFVYLDVLLITTRQ